MNKKNGLTEGKTTQNIQDNYTKILGLGLTKQPYRMALYVCQNPGKLTHTVGSVCAIGNVSDAAIRANPDLATIGLKLVCRQPVPRIKTRFGDPSPVQEWHLVSTGA